MTTATPVYTARTLIAAGTTNAAGATTRATLDLRGKFGGQLTIKITNGATAPTVQAVANVLIAHNDGATPAAGSAGADWKTHYPSVGGGTTNNAVNEWSYAISGVQHLEVEITGNTAQGVTCEAYLTEFTSVNNA